ncbi:unnamed protein product, partial [Scytosiphon promiscuus]
SNPISSGASSNVGTRAPPHDIPCSTVPEFSTGVVVRSTGAADATKCGRSTRYGGGSCTRAMVLRT